MKIAGVILILLSLAVGGIWFSHGAFLATQEKIPVTEKTIDDFGDETETVTWKEPTDFPVTGFHIGLDRAAPVGGAFFLLGAVLLFLGFRKKKAQA